MDGGPGFGLGVERGAEVGGAVVPGAEVRGADGVGTAGTELTGGTELDEVLAGAATGVDVDG